MSGISSVAFAIAVIIVALALILVALWVSRLSSRVNALSEELDRLRGQGYDHHSPSVRVSRAYEDRSGMEYQAPNVSHGNPRNSEPEAHVEQVSPVEAGVEEQEVQAVFSEPRDIVADAGIVAEDDTVTASEDDEVVIGESIIPEESPSDFIAGYAKDADRNDHARKRGPVIPFGADKTAARSTRDASDYADAAIGFESDPDTVDFKRVSGYRNIQRRRSEK